MSNYRVAWLLLASYIALLALSSSGITLSFFLPAKPKPTLEEANITEADLKPKYDRYHHNERNRKVPDVVKKYAIETESYADYSHNPRIYLVIPCGVSILVTLPLVLGGLCSRKLFSSSVGLYSSVCLWGLNLAGVITFLIGYCPYFGNENFAPLITILGVQIGMLLILTLQVIVAAWELRRQKMSLFVLNLSQLLGLNSVFLVARIVLGCYMLDDYHSHSRMWQGIRDERFNNLYDEWSYWNGPKIKTPEYLVYPLTIGLIYSIIVPCESLMSHLLGHVNTKMLSFTTMVSAIFYGGAIYVVSPAFIQMTLSTFMNTEIMFWAIGLFFLSLVHGIINLAKPSLLNAPASISNIVVAARWLPSTGYTSDDVKNRTAALRSKFKGSDTLLFNTIIMLLCSLALILALCSGVYGWGGITMVCGDAVVLSRVVTSLIMETVTQKVESVPILKMLMQVFIECVILLVGSIGSFGWFYGGIAVAIIIHFVVVIMQLYKVVKNPVLQAAAAKLSTEQTSQSDTREQISERLLETDSLAQEEEESSCGIYQPAV